MRKIFIAICVCLMVFPAVGSAFAEELWDYHLRGVDEGLVAGALPPPGLYFVNNMYFVPNFKHYNNAAESDSNFKLSSYVDVPILEWATGYQFLGASYGAAIAQPFDFTDLRVYNPDTGNTITGEQWGAYNTILVPFILSWDLPCYFHVSTSMSFGMNDGTTSPGDSYASISKIGLYGLESKDRRNIYAWSSNDSYQFTPTVGVSWLYANWNISAEFMYTVYTKDHDTNYQNGDEFQADYTISYNYGKWTFGLGAEQQNQLYNDKFNAGDGLGYRKQPGTMAANYTMGPLIGYNFGPCSLMAVYNWPLETKNDVGGEWFNLRLVIPLGDPCSWVKS